MIAISIAITTSALFISMAAIYAVYTWAEIHAKKIEILEADRRMARAAISALDDEDDGDDDND